ncbi:MAG: hypothetical protein QW303_00095 [Nitrososphaerota archaeon]
MNPIVVCLEKFEKDAAQFEDYMLAIQKIEHCHHHFTDEEKEAAREFICKVYARKTLPNLDRKSMIKVKRCIGIFAIYRLDEKDPLRIAFNEMRENLSKKCT